MGKNIVNPRFFWLDMARAISAFCVCAGHLRRTMLLDYRDVTHPTILHIVFYALAGVANQAVIVFFVLSGFFVGGSVLQSGKNFSLANYALARLTRLWLVLFPALILTFCIDKVTSVYHPGFVHGVYADCWNLGTGDGTYSVSLKTLVGNILSLQTIIVPVFGSNAPLWSLANEFWYYCLFPACVLAARRGVKKCYRILAGLCACVILAFLPAKMLMGYLIWLMGAVAWVICRRTDWKPSFAPILVALFFFLASLGYPVMEKVLSVSAGAVCRDIIVGVGFAPLCVILAKLSPPELGFISYLIVKYSVFSAKFSYSLYLIHFPCIFLMVSLLNGDKKILMKPDALGIALFCGLFAALIVVAVCFWFLFEKRTAVVRAFFKRQLIQRQNVA